MDSLSGPVAGTAAGRWLRSPPGEKPPKRIRDDAETGVEIVLSNGRRLAVLRGFDGETLRRVADALERPC